MLHLRIKPSTEPLTYNIDGKFHMTLVPDTPLVRELITQIEKGYYLSERSFLDRFGEPCRYSEISTGCKAALTVALHPDIEVDLTECGLNAIDAILHLCKDGHIAMYYPYDCFIYDYDELESLDVDIEYNGYRYTKLDRLDTYFRDEWMEEPDLTLEGVEKL